MMKTVILSDCHIGSPESNYRCVEEFLHNLECDRLILAGDFWDLWDCSAKELRDRHESAVRELQRVAARGIQVDYVLGNHDAGYRKNQVVPLLTTFNECTFTTPGGRRVLVVHGHQYDWIMRKHYSWYRLVAVINKFLAVFGLSYKKWQSLSKHCGEAKYSEVVRDMHSTAMADCRKRCDVLVMGHTHTPMHTTVDGLEFVNAGDWKYHNTYAVVIGDEITLETFRSVKT